MPFALHALCAAMFVTIAGAAVAGPRDDAPASVREDYATALQIYRDLADRNKPHDQDFPGDIYRYGADAVQSYEQALELYREYMDHDEVPKP